MLTENAHAKARYHHSGSLIRSGTNCEYHVVDERIVGKKPVSLGFAQAAALLLTTITADARFQSQLHLKICRTAFRNLEELDWLFGEKKF